MWASCNVSIKQSLETTQKKIIRNLLKKNRYEASSPLFKQLRLLKIDDICKLNALMFVYKTIHGIVNSSVTFTLRYVEAYHLRGESSLNVPFARTNQSKRFIHVRGAEVWNATPVGIRNSRTILTLKRKIKMHFLDSY